MKLYWFWSFNPQKVRLALNELGLEHELVVVDLFRREQRSPEFLAINPFGKVPVLEDGGRYLAESNAIVAWLGERDGRLWPEATVSRAAALQWLFFEARHLNPLVGRLWFHDFVAPQAGIEDDSERREIAAMEIEAPLKRLDGHLSERRWMLGDEFSLVDCCFAAVLDALSLSDFDLRSYGSIEPYLARVRGRPSWGACEFRERVA